ncbi:MAG: IS66 family transposase [Desulfitobacteriaceae bacterium]
MPKITEYIAVFEYFQYNKGMDLKGQRRMMIYLEQELSNLKESEKKLREENEIKQKRIEILEHNVEALTQALLQAAKQRFGASSEKTPDGNGQLYFFEEETELPSEEEKAQHNL